MKPIFINAYTNFNLGDDLFIKILCERYPDQKFVIYAPKKYKITFKKHGNLFIFPQDIFVVKLINYMSRKIGIKKISIRNIVSKNSKAIVHIGGSIFMEGSRWKEKLKNIEDMKRLNQAYFVLGANFGPYKDKEFLSYHKEVFKGYMDICFREKYSYELFDELENVRWADDIVFQLEQKYPKKKKPNIVISIIKPSFRKNLDVYDGIYFEKIKNITIYFIDKGYEVTMMSFCEKEGDKEAVETIFQMIPQIYKDKVFQHFYKWDMEESLSIIEASDFVIATRFHSMILGWIYNKPVFPIVYSDKMYNVMNDVGFKGASTNFPDIENLKPEEVFESMNKNSINVSRQIKNANKHFEKLDCYLLEK